MQFVTLVLVLAVVLAVVAVLAYRRHQDEAERVLAEAKVVETKVEDTVKGAIATVKDVASKV